MKSATPFVIAISTLSLCHSVNGQQALLRGMDQEDQDHHRNLDAIFKYVGNNDEISSHQLGECEGDCDSDYDCQYGLVCQYRDDEEVFGCHGTADDYTDYCAEPKLNQLVLVGNNDFASGTLQRCEGDCDNDSDCAAGLKCFQRDYWTDVPGCVGDGAKHSDYCYEPVSLAYVGNNDNDYHGLGLCEGDCDDSSDCEYGLMCYQRSSSNLDAVPGCEGTPTDSNDYCTYPWMIDQLVVVGNNNLKEKLGVCQGDCDEDSDCEDGLICDLRFDDEEVIGCNNEGGIDGYDYCILPPKNWLVKVGNDGVPSYKFPLAQCEGDCDNDDDCEGNLVCRHRDGYEVVPGCEGLGSEGVDYCSPIPDDGATRVVAFGDVHGDVNAAREALMLAGVIDQNDNWIGGTTNVVQCGDQTDRGDTERDVLDLFETLIVAAQNAGGAFYPLIGNHEIMNAKGNFNDVSDEGWKQFEDISYDANDSDINSYDENKRGRVAAFKPGGLYAKMLSYHHVILTLEGSLFVHGGVLPAHLDYGIEKINKEISDWLRGLDVPEPDTNDIEDEDHPLWSRHYSDEPSDADCELLEEVLQRTGMERMVVAHTIQWYDGIHSGCDGKIWKVDVGMSEYYDEDREVEQTQILEIVDGIVSVIRG